MKQVMLLKELGSLLLQPLQRGDAVAVDPRRQHRAGQHRLFIEKDRAKAAVGSLAAALDALAAEAAHKVQQHGVSRVFRRCTFYDLR